MKSFVFFLFLLTLWQLSFASLFHSQEHKIHREISNGDYKHALKSNKKLLKKITKKYPDSTYLIGNLHIQQGLIKSYMDEPFKESKTDFEKGLAIIENKFGKKHVHYQKGLLNVFEIYQSKGYFIQADSLLTVIKENNLLQDEIDKKEISFLMALGYYDDSYKKATSLKKKITNDISEFVTYKNKKGKIIQKKLPNDEYMTRKRVYANHLHLMAQILIEKGNYTEADTLLNDAELWIEKEITKFDISMVDNYFLKGLVLTHRNKLAEALLSFENAFDLVNHTHFHFQYLETSLQYAKLTEQLALAYWKDGKIDLATDVVNVYSPKVKRFYKRDNYHRGFLELLDAEKQFIKGHYEKAGKMGQKFIEKGLIKTDNYSLQHIAYKKLIPIYEKLEAYDLIDKMYSSLDSLKNIQFPSNAPRFHEDEIYKAIYYTRYTNKFKDAQTIFDNSFLKIVEKNFHSMSHKHLYFSNALADLYEIMGNYSEAKKILEIASKNSEKNYDNFDYRIGLQWLRLANLDIETGDYQGAREKLTRIENLYNEKVNNHAEGKASVYVYYAKLYLLTGQYSEAEDMLMKARRESNNNQFSQKDIAEFATLYIKQGNYSKVEEILLETIEIKEELYGVDSRHLLTSLNQLAELYWIKGEYIEADQYSDRAVKISFDIYGVESLKYASSLKLQARIAKTIGDFDHAINDYNRVLTTQQKLLGKEHIAVASTLTEKAITEFLKNKETEGILETLTKSAKIVENQLGKENPLYAEMLQYIADYYISTNQLEQADSYLEKANFIWLQKAGLGKTNINSTYILSLRSEILKKQGKYTEALELLTKSSNQYKHLFHKEHPKYVETLSKMAKLYYVMGNEKKAIKTLNKTTNIYLNFISNYFDGLSERQKTKFWNLIRSDFEFYNTIALKSGKPKLIAKSYKHVLQTKGILLNSSIALRRTITQSNDEILIAKFTEWQKSKEKLSSYIGLSTEELKTQNISLEQEEKNVTVLEKELSEMSEAFKQKKETKHLTWKNIKSKLVENEVAIEIIRYRYFDKVFTDSIVYAALVIDPTTKKAPKVVILEDGNLLEKKYTSYYRNTMKYQIEDELSYKAFWEKIANVVGKSTVYLSTEGVYTQVNVESFKSPEGHYVLDKNKIVLVNNTKDLLKKKTKNKANLSAVFIGNPAFYDENIAIVGHGNRSLDQSMAQLPGAEEEVHKSHNLFLSKGWSSQEVIHEKATEDFIRNDVKRPAILHIATHGFVLQNPEIEEDQFGFISRQEMNNPLLRCGLMLQHAGDIFEKQPFYNYNIENGILTGNEARNLSLEGTEIVFLSACETGLGEIQVGEGVQGLVRAFSEAGAKTIIMSLFKVSDEATNLLASTFYKIWLETGDKQEAFIDAKKEVRKKFPEPIYWGAFILIGE